MQMNQYEFYLRLGWPGGTGKEMQIAGYKT